MTTYLLDTNIISDLLRHPQGAVTRRIREAGESRVRTSVVVAAELRYGAAKKNAARLSAQLEAILGAIEIVPFQAPADKTYGLLRARLEREGRVMGGNDMLIAAHALALGDTLITDNVREFARVKGLRVENWLRDRPA